MGNKFERNYGENSSGDKEGNGRMILKQLLENRLRMEMPNDFVISMIKIMFPELEN